MEINKPTVAYDSPEWHQVIERIEKINLQTNRGTFCLECWKIHEGKQKVAHKKKHPQHRHYTLTS